jgi:hypothetical protein
MTYFITPSINASRIFDRNLQSSDNSNRDIDDSYFPTVLELVSSTV